MKQWLSELRASWRDKTFVCAMLVFFLSYVLIALIASLLPPQIVVTILGAIAGWQIADWSFSIAPKIKKLLFKEK